MKFILTWILRIVGGLSLLGGLVGYFFFNGKAVNDAKDCANVVSDACQIVSSYHFSAPGSALIAILGLVCLFFAWLINQ
ncbi:hypothetical protein FXO89_23185 [Salmonella enterica]|nr:hypothetical protein [Salmonella enterica]